MMNSELLERATKSAAKSGNSPQHEITNVIQNLSIDEMEQMGIEAGHKRLIHQVNNYRNADRADFGKPSHLSRIRQIAWGIVEGLRIEKITGR